MKRLMFVCAVDVSQSVQTAAVFPFPVSSCERRCRTKLHTNKRRFNLISSLRAGAAAHVDGHVSTRTSAICLIWRRWRNERKAAVTAPPAAGSSAVKGRDDGTCAGIRNCYPSSLSNTINKNFWLHLRGLERSHERVLTLDHRSSLWSVLQSVSAAVEPGADCLNLHHVLIVKKTRVWISFNFPRCYPLILQTVHIDLLYGFMSCVGTHDLPQPPRRHVVRVAAVLYGVMSRVTDSTAVLKYCVYLFCLLSFSL